ncbi:MAG: PDZ domain-containing protein, partial [Pseudomonadota bacterium]|nr:PDZ domain-containing protein [Pseudomonadota bacterium]
SGIVSALARTQVGINDLNFFIQTDAAINPGNSGGALITLDGKLVGLNSAIYSKGGGSVGIGFAIPSNMIKSILAGVTPDGRIIRPWIGAIGQSVTFNIAESLGLERPTGVLISEIYANGPADRAGLRVGDVILKINNREINDYESMRFHVVTQLVGDKVNVVALRKKAKRRFDITINTPPKMPAPNLTELTGVHPLQGALVANLSPALADELKMSLFKMGVVVFKLKSNSAARRFGIKLKDIIQTINTIEIKKVTDLFGAINGSGKRWQIIIERSGKKFSLIVE